MRRIVCLAAALVVLTAGAARAEEKADSKAVIEKAIKAAGGEEKLAKFKAATFKMKGKWYGMGDGIDYTERLRHPAARQDALQDRGRRRRHEVLLRPRRQR